MSKGLKALRKLEKELSEYYGTDIAYYPETFEMFSTISNELKALEIIKKNELLSVYQDNGRYFVIFTGKYGFEHTTNVEIPKEEYDLLKGVLL